jgi:hypothetical protein
MKFDKDDSVKSRKVGMVLGPVTNHRCDVLRRPNVKPRHQHRVRVSNVSTNSRIYIKYASLPLSPALKSYFRFDET